MAEPKNKVERPALPFQKPAEPSPAVAGIESASDEWLKDHPDGSTFADTKPAEPKPAVEVKPDPATEAKPVAAEPAQPVATQPAPAEAPPQAAATPAEPAAPAEPDATQPAAVAAKPAEPAKPAPSYAPSDTFELAQGVAWTRQQLIDSLNEGIAARTDRDLFAQTFRMDATTAATTWKPVLEAFAHRRENLPFVEQFLFGDPQRTQWLIDAAAHYDAEWQAAGGAGAGAQPAGAAAAAPVDPQLASDVHELKTWRDQQFSRQSANRVNREVAYAYERYPFLRTDRGAFEALRATALSLNREDAARGVPQHEGRGVLEALELLAPTFDGRMIALRDQERAAANPQPVVPPPSAAVTLPSGGNGAVTDRQRQPRPKTFAGDADAAVQDWIDNTPSEFR